MDTHTLELLEFDRVRALVASYAACSMGKAAALAMEPSTDPAEIHHRQALTSEMTEALVSGLAPPLGGLIDIREAVRRAAVGATLDAEELARISSSLCVAGDVRRWLNRIAESFPRLGSFQPDVLEFGSLANTIDGCIDARGQVLDTASRRLSEIRRDAAKVEERIQETLRRLLRAPEIRKILRYPNFTVVGHHYVLPIAREHRGEIQGAVHRTSASNETVYIEPQAVAERSAQLSYLRARETKEVRRILRSLSAQVGRESEPILGTMAALEQLDLVLARGRYAIDFRMTAPDLNTEGVVVLRGARHPILEHLFREEHRRGIAPEPAGVAETDASPPETSPTSDTDAEASQRGENAPPTETAQEAQGFARGFHEPPLGRPSSLAEPKPRSKTEPLNPAFLQGPAGAPARPFDPPVEPQEPAAEQPEAPEEPEPPPLKGGLSGPALNQPAKARRGRPGDTSSESSSTRAEGDSRSSEPNRRARPSTPAREVTPIDIHLGSSFHVLIITGPNTGGKTVALKTVGLLAVMAQCGLRVTALQGSKLPILDDVLADIGDEQSLEQSLSTFSSHVKRITEILGKATERSLVMLDELGAGTDPTEGAALGRAILDELDAIGCRALVTTHIGALKTYAFSNPRAENAAVEFDLESLRPLYRVRIGDIGQSNALQIARRLEMPHHLVDRAARYLAEDRDHDSPSWDVIQQLRKEAEDARQQAIEEQAEAERTREALSRKLADLQSQAEQDARLEEARARLKPGDRVVVPRLGYDRPGRVVRVDAKKNKAAVSIGQMTWDVPIDELIPQLLPSGEASSKSRGR